MTRTILAVSALVTVLGLLPCVAAASDTARAPQVPVERRVPSDSLGGPAWTVVEIEGVAIGTGIGVTIEFAISGSHVSGSSGCNRYAGGFSLAGESLSFAAPLASSMMACEDPQMAVERRFLDALASVDRFNLAGHGQLVLLRADRPVIRARR